MRACTMDPRVLSGMRLYRKCQVRWHSARSVANTSNPTGAPARASAQQQQEVEWPGLAVWRAKGIDDRRGWGKKGSCSSVAAPGWELYEHVPLAPSLVDCGLQVLMTAEPRAKAALTHRAWSAYCSGHLPLNSSQQPHTQLPARPARPERPQLVVPKKVPSPKDSPLPLSAHMLHNLAHIELNAIDLAWDTVVRFSPLALPASFYEDFARVADDEGRHLGWCLQRLQELGADYGDMVAHDLLWEGCHMSAGDLNARLAVVPMSQEARGLDAGQRLVDRLVGTGDARSASIVAQIALEEKAHVAVGVAWFRRTCAALGAEPGDTFRAWIGHLCPDVLKGPFNDGARVEVGLDRRWYDIKLWPEGAKGGLVDPQRAAAARGMGLPLTGGGVGGGEGGGEGEGGGPAVLQQEQLALLRARLGAMLEMEAAAGAGGGGSSGGDDGCGVGGSAVAADVRAMQAAVAS